MQEVLYYSNLIKITIVNNNGKLQKGKKKQKQNIQMYYGNNEGQIV